MQADGRKLWLDECLVNSTTLLVQTEKTEQKRNLTTRERKIKHLSTAYLYLYTKMQEEGLISSGDEDNFFKPETLH
jgi:hypothetical protein